MFDGDVSYEQPTGIHYELGWNRLYLIDVLAYCA